MAYDCRIFGRTLSEAFVQWLIEEQWPVTHARFTRLWDYYQNTMTPLPAALSDCDNARTYLQAQEIGLPTRITGLVFGDLRDLEQGSLHDEIQRKEVVIENDIAWRINAMVDFLFGKQIRIISRSPNPDRRRDIEQILKAVFDANGGAVLFQDMAVLGSVYGFADCMIRPGPAILARFAGTSPVTSQTPASLSFSSVLRDAATIDLELIDASRALPVLDENDCRKIRHYIQYFHQAQNDLSDEDSIDRLLHSSPGPRRRRTAAVTEIIGPDAWQRYEGDKLVAQSANPFGFVPVVHIQNIAQPGFYEGLSDVEQLIALQDELNTRLSDRASRLTMQSFKMYLLKGFDGIGEKRIGPGQMWSTDNPDAAIESFGGDQVMPSENAHIAEIREAMDKISGVTPVVAGVLKNKLGNLTSGVALKMTYMGMLTKTSRKQFTYGQGIRRIGWMILEMLDKAGLYPTGPEDRDLDIEFPNPLPEDGTQIQKTEVRSQKSE